MLAVLSLEPGTGKRAKAAKSSSKTLGDGLAQASSVAALKRSWKQNSFTGKEDKGDSEQPSTSAGGSQSSDVALVEELSGEDIGNDCFKPATGSQQQKAAKSPKSCVSLEGSVEGACFSAASLLRYRHAVALLPVAEELQTLCSQELEAEQTPQGRDPSDRALFGSHKISSHTQRKDSNVLTPSAQAYRPGSSPKNPKDELKRQVQALLNKVCPESIATIVERISDIQVKSSEDLEIIISIIFKKALTEPHYCETYADLVFGLKQIFPEFPSPTGGKPVTFKSTLLNTCQAEFDNLPVTLEPTKEELAEYDAEELEYRRKRTKDRVLANMKLIGHLFLRQLLSAKVIGSIIQELTLCSNADQIPEEHVTECAVELIMAIGYTLESMPVGQAALQQVCGRLQDLKVRKGPDGKGVYCKRIQFAIQGLLDVRKAGWTKKVFSGVAKTKEEIRLEQQKELHAQAAGLEVSCAQKVVAGHRPVYLVQAS